VGVVAAGARAVRRRPRDERAGEALGAIVRQADAHWHGPEAEPIRLLPRALEPSGLPAPSREGIAIGIEERRCSRPGSTCSAPIRTSWSSATPRAASRRCCAGSRTG